jgi:sugar phosphate isomerase/epimerase
MRARFRMLVAAFMATIALPASGAPREKPATFPANVGVQIYSFRNQLKEDLPGTLALVRKVGFRDVELYSLHGKTAPELKKILDAAGLRAHSMHQPYARFKDDITGIIADGKALGLRYVGCAFIPHEGEYTSAMNQAAIDVFNTAGEALNAAGLRFFYHPHGYEFAEQGQGATLFDAMVAATKPGVVDYEMDVFWVAHAGVDPVALFEKYPTRFPLFHIKDMAKNEPTGRTAGTPGKAPHDSSVILGTGQIDVARLVASANRTKKVSWYFLEDESSRVLEQIPQSLKFLKAVGTPAKSR